jgi:short-subunit dehydrogenase
VTAAARGPSGHGTAGGVKGGDAGLSQERVRCAVVTGASSGIGAALARALSARGAHCLLVGRRADRLQALAGELSGSGAGTEAVVCDVTAADSAGAALAALERRGLEADLLVQSAGFGVYGPLAESPPDRLGSLVDVNCRALLVWARAFLPGMLARRRGGLIFVASTAAFVPMPYYAAYGASKAFAVGLGRSLSAELAGSGVRVLTVCPGPVQTEFFSVAGAPGPLGRPGGGADTPERVAAETLAAWDAGRRVHVVGARNRALVLAARWAPAPALDAAARRTLRPRRR